MKTIASICTKCGAHFPREAGFCGFDGSGLSLCEFDGAAPAELVAAKQCAKCSRQYPSYANYCGVDGTSLENAAPLPLSSENGDKDNLHQHSTETEAEVANEPSSRQPPNVKSPPHRRLKTQVQDSDDSEALEQDLSPIESGIQAPLELTADEVRDTMQIDSLIGKTLDGKYRIESALAEGGMAVLYKAQQIAMERSVVVKLIHDSLMYRTDMIERFQRECKMAARLNHPNVVSVYDFGFVNKTQPYLVMEFIKGKSLSNYLTQRRPAQNRHSRTDRPADLRRAGRGAQLRDHSPRFETGQYIIARSRG